MDSAAPEQVRTAESTKRTTPWTGAVERLEQGEVQVRQQTGWSFDGGCRLAFVHRETDSETTGLQVTVPGVGRMQKPADRPQTADCS
jgi:hypothetical protein